MGSPAYSLPVPPVPRGVMGLEWRIPASPKLIEYRVVGEKASRQARRSSEDNGRDTE